MPEGRWATLVAQLFELKVLSCPPPLTAVADLKKPQLMTV
jgi:hypothetical protein